ncbi:MAG: VIT1/CCC1 transporter family protein [Nitrososphaerota archaeon]|nr:VIT1/CCC1 transporter family protein [Nitrososphaerota archaeon]
MKGASAAEKHARSGLLSNFILGSQDGLVNVLGILLGLVAATSDVRLIFVAALAALGAESISMGAVAYTSTLARRKQYLKEVEREQQEMKELPDKERQEVREIFERWGYAGEQLERVTDVIVSNPRAWLELMMAHELYLQPVDESEPRQSFTVVLTSTIVGSLIPLIPFFISTADLLADAVASILLSGGVLFFVGYYEARTTVGSLWRSGLQMALIGLAAGLAGFLIGHFIGAPAG